MFKKTKKVSFCILTCLTDSFMKLIKMSFVIKSIFKWLKKKIRHGQSQQMTTFFQRVITFLWKISKFVLKSLVSIPKIKKLSWLLLVFYPQKISLKVLLLLVLYYILKTKPYLHGRPAQSQWMLCLRLSYHLLELNQKFKIVGN